MTDFKVRNKARGGGKNNSTKSQAKKNKQKEVYNQKHIRIMQAKIQGKSKPSPETAT